MKRADINSREDVTWLVTTFYEKLVSDDLVGFFFREHMSDTLEKHLPMIIKFWMSILFGEYGFVGNPMIKHINLNKKAKLTADHFERWISLWNSTLDQRFEGEKVEAAKAKARSLGDLMLYKIRMSEGSQFIQ